MNYSGKILSWILHNLNIIISVCVTSNMRSPKSHLVSLNQRNKWVENLFNRMKECLAPFVNKKSTDLKDNLIFIETRSNLNIRAYINCILCTQEDLKSSNVYLSCKIRGNHRYWNIQNFKRHLYRNHKENTQKDAYTRKAGKQKINKPRTIALVEESAGK